MCEPISLTALAVGSTAYSAYAMNEQGKAQQKYYDYQARIQEEQARLEEEAGQQNAIFAQDQGMRELVDQKRSLKKTMGAQKAAIASLGGDSGGVGAEDLAIDSIDQGKKDEVAIRYNSEMNAWNAKNQARNKAWDLKNQASMSRASGANARAAGRMNATGTLLSGASQAGSSYYSMTH